MKCDKCQKYEEYICTYWVIFPVINGKTFNLFGKYDKTPLSACLLSTWKKK